MDIEPAIVYIVLSVDDGDDEPYIDSVWLSKEAAEERARNITGWVIDSEISHRGNTDY